MLNSDQFLRLSLNERFQLLRDEGTFVASRFFASYNVHLFTLYGFYVEMYQLISLNQVAYIEVVNSPSRIKEYANSIDLKKDLGIDLNDLLK